MIGELADADSSYTDACGRNCVSHVRTKEQIEAAGAYNRDQFVPPPLTKFSQLHFFITRVNNIHSLYLTVWRVLANEKELAYTVDSRLVARDHTSFAS